MKVVMAYVCQIWQVIFNRSKGRYVLPKIPRKFPIHDVRESKWYSIDTSREGVTSEYSYWVLLLKVRVCPGQKLLAKYVE